MLIIKTVVLVSCIKYYLQHGIYIGKSCISVFLSEIYFWIYSNLKNILLLFDTLRHTFNHCQTDLNNNKQRCQQTTTKLCKC